MSLFQAVVVEDNEDNRMLLEAILEGRFDITCFAEGESALAALSPSAAVPDILLLDISLPGLDGIEVLKRLRAQAHTSSIPAIALTAHAMDGDEKRFLAEGFDAYHAKPIVDEDALLDKMEQLIKERQHG